MSLRALVRSIPRITASPHTMSPPVAPAPHTFANFFDRFPKPVATPGSITVDELAALMRDEGEVAGHTYVVVDVRRMDLEEDVHYVLLSAINLPAQSFHQTLPTMGTLLSSIPKVIFHCSSSNGRGPRCAGWYADYLAAHSLTGQSESLVLKGGIKAWLDSEHGRTAGGVKDVLGDYRDSKI